MTTTELAPRAEEEARSASNSTPPAPPSERTPRRRMKRPLKIAFIVILTVSLLEAIAFAGTYLLVSRHYVTTDNAQVDGDQIKINAPVTGIVTDWSITGGSVVRENQIVGRVQSTGGGAQATRPVRAPGDGTVAVNTVDNGEYVAAGTALATAYDPSTIHVTARVDETDIAAVRIGQPVDISVDAYPNTPVLGTVTQIQAAAAGKFTIYPSPDSDPSNPQKIDQYIPVKIAITDNGGAQLLPGMNVTVKIHRD